MKSEVRNLNEKTRYLPFPKLMISKDTGVIILALEKEDDNGMIAGVVLKGNDVVKISANVSMEAIGLYTLPENVEIVLSNKR